MSSSPDVIGVMGMRGSRRAGRSFGEGRIVLQPPALPVLNCPVVNQIGEGAVGTLVLWDREGGDRDCGLQTADRGPENPAAPLRYAAA